MIIMVEYKYSRPYASSDPSRPLGEISVSIATREPLHHLSRQDLEKAWEIEVTATDPHHQSPRILAGVDYFDETTDPEESYHDKGAGLSYIFPENGNPTYEEPESEYISLQTGEDGNVESAWTYRRGSGILSANVDSAYEPEQGRVTVSTDRLKGLVRVRRTYDNSTHTEVVDLSFGSRYGRHIGFRRTHQATDIPTLSNDPMVARLGQQDRDLLERILNNGIDIDSTRRRMLDNYEAVGTSGTSNGRSPQQLLSMNN